MAQNDCFLAVRLRHFQNAIDAEKALGEGIEKRGSVGTQHGFHAICGGLGQRAIGVIFCLQHVGRHGGGKDDRLDPIFAVAGYVAGNFAAAHGKANEGGFFQIHQVHDARQIIGQRVIIKAIGGFVRLAKAASIIGDHAKTGFRQGGHLGGPRRAGQGPAVDQHDRTASAAAVFDVQVDVVGGDKGHDHTPAKGGGSAFADPSP